MLYTETYVILYVHSISIEKKKDQNTIKESIYEI